MKASQVTKVTSTAGHPRTQGLVERQNRTLLTMLRIFCSRRMHNWDWHLDEVLGAYNSTRHATTGFSPYMLTRGTGKAIPLTYLSPEFATQAILTHDAYVDHVLAHRQEINDKLKNLKNLDMNSQYEPKPIRRRRLGLGFLSVCSPKGIT